MCITLVFGLEAEIFVCGAEEHLTVLGGKSQSQPVIPPPNWE
jgi:hypothetical protein